MGWIVNAAIFPQKFGCARRQLTGCQAHYAMYIFVYRTTLKGRKNKLSLSSWEYALFKMYAPMAYATFSFIEFVKQAKFYIQSCAPYGFSSVVPKFDSWGSWKWRNKIRHNPPASRNVRCDLSCTRITRKVRPIMARLSWLMCFLFPFMPGQIINAVEKKQIRSGGCWALRWTATTSLGRFSGHIHQE